LAFVLSASWPTILMVQDARSILQKMQQRERARWEGVNNYVIGQPTTGHRALLFCEKIQSSARQRKYACTVHRLNGVFLRQELLF
jgi:hypothetical protein